MTGDADFVTKALADVRAKSPSCASCDAKKQRPPEYPITINFHPDRMTKDTKKPLLVSIAQDGELKSQFETGTSNGGLTAFAGGDRWTWEQRVFDGAYDQAPLNQRPKYGALNFRGYPMGAAPRFGSSFFVLKPHVLQRTSFCYPDSFFGPKDFSVQENMSHLIAKAEADVGVDLLDDYIEAHIHGVLSLQEDVESVVLDPIYRETEIERQAKLLGVPVKWHRGFQLTVDQIRQHPDYRGPQFIALAEQVAENGTIHPALLGEAVSKQGHDEQAIKKVWHYIARFGHPSLEAECSSNA